MTDTTRRIWASFENIQPLTQSYPGGIVKGVGGYTKTRTWPGTDGGEVPIISGNSLRGRLRRVMAEDLFTQVGIQPKQIKPRVAHVFIVGGALPKDGLRTLSPDGELELKSLIPPLALLGGTVLCVFLTGRLAFGDFVALTSQTYEPYLRAVGVDRDDLPDPAHIVNVDYHVRSNQDLAAIWSEEELAADNIKDAEESDDERKNAERSLPHGVQSVLPGQRFVGSVAVGTYRGLDDHNDLGGWCISRAVDARVGGRDGRESHVWDSGCGVSGEPGDSGSPAQCAQ
ncbi:MAG: hypothetical protein ACP5P1_14770 [Acidimicrobiales bacterium]